MTYNYVSYNPFFLVAWEMKSRFLPTIIRTNQILDQGLAVM